MAKISVIVPSENKRDLERKSSAFSSICRVDTNIQVAGVPGAAKSPESFFDVGQLGPQLLQLVRYFQTNGSDAIVIDNIRDPLLGAARQLSEIPVVAAGEAAFHTACLLAEKFSIITGSAGNIPALHINLQAYGLSNKVSSIRCIEKSLSKEDIGNLEAGYLELAERVIQVDDAHAIILDYEDIPGLENKIQLHLSRKGISIPVLNPSKVAVKLAEVLLDLNLSHSKRSFPYPPTVESPGYSYLEPILLKAANGQSQLNARIMLIVPSSVEGTNQVSGNTFAFYCQPTVTLEAVNLDIGPHSIESEYDDALAVPQISRKALAADKAGIDGIIIECMADPGIHACREITNSIVLAPGSVSMHIASILADKFSIITVLEQSIPEIERQIARFGLSARAASVRAVELHVLELRDQPDRLLDEFVSEAIKAIENDGAHFIIPGCTGMVGLHERVLAAVSKYQVPVIDQNAALVKICEMFLSLGLSHSKISYPNPQNNFDPQDI